MGPVPSPTLTICIPTLNAARTLPVCLAALAHAGATLIVADGGSNDGTHGIATASGAQWLEGPRGRGSQLAAAAERATTDWLLFVHADSVLAAGWHDEAAAFMTRSGNERRAAAFRFALDDGCPQARRLERLVAWRCRWLGLPYGDQGLLISRRFYDEIGGFRPLPLMEDVDLVRRIGRTSVVLLRTAAVTSAARWRREGWLNRSARNLCCLTLFVVGVPPRVIHRVYGA